MRPALPFRAVGTPVVVAALALVLAACGSSGSSGGSGGGQQTIAGLSANDHGAKDVTGMATLEVEADNYYFNPTVLKGSPGQQLTLEIKNETSTEHNFTLESQQLNKDISEGTTATVKLTFPASGTLSFFCEYHKAKGMAGGLQAS
jgi:plastocyanin